MKERAKGKAIFIDGASAHVTKSALGIGTYNFHGLYDVLRNEVGTCRRIVGIPIVTVGPDAYERGYGLVKDLAGAGFNVVPARSDNGEDDEFIKTRIRGLDPREVEEIVIFTSDKDFIPVLREKANVGVRIYWVSTKHHEPGLNRHCLSQDVIQLCMTTPGFSFVEIAEFKGAITGKRPWSTATATSYKKEDVTIVTIRLQNMYKEEHGRLIRSIQSLTSEFAGLTFIVE